ncbi:hypothetical protein [Aureibaculum luteum]|uniref:hypothetical protein n=1 Tax=Aureibaculum luteum TaxID=1548456 RepID=UPI001E3C9344|nr:hypothetical protein [Aureibaculum luteum]
MAVVIIPNMEIQNTVHGDSGKRRTPAKINGVDGNKKRPRIRQIAIYVENIFVEFSFTKAESESCVNLSGYKKNKVNPISTSTTQKILR